MRQLGIHIVRRQKTFLYINQSVPVRSQKTHPPRPIVYRNPIAIPVVHPSQSSTNYRILNFSNSPQSRFDLRHLSAHLSGISQMLGDTTPARLKKRARWRHPIRRGLHHLYAPRSRKGFMLFRQDNPHFFPHRRIRNKYNLPIVPGDTFPAIGDFRDRQLDRVCTRLGKIFQYQLSFKSAGGNGLTCPVSWAGIFIDLVGIKNVPISIAPTPISITIRDTPWVNPRVSP